MRTSTLAGFSTPPPYCPEWTSWRRPLDADLPVRDAAQPVADGRHALVVERVAVGHDAHVGAQQVGMIVDERLDRRGADLLVALEEEAQVDRQPAGGAASTPRPP